MPSRTLGSPLLMAFLRALAFVGITEAVFYRLMPPPSGGGGPGALRDLHASLYRAGNLTFFFAFFLVLIAMVTAAWRTLRGRIWPGATNGLVAALVLCVAALGFSTVAMERGPAFAIGFTILALATVLFVTMQAYARADGLAERLFAVSYAAAVLSSAVGTIARFAERFERVGPSGQFLCDRSVAAGEFLLAVTGALSFLAFHEIEEPGRSGPGPRRLPMLLGALAAIAFAVGSLLAPPGLALLGPDPGAFRVLALSVGLFLATLTTTACLLDPDRRLKGYGLLLILLAGFPLRIAYQHMTAVLGTVLLFSPQPVESSQPVAAGFAPGPGMSLPPAVDEIGPVAPRPPEGLPG